MKNVSTEFNSHWPIKYYGKSVGLALFGLLVIWSTSTPAVAAPPAQCRQASLGFPITGSAQFDADYFVVDGNSSGGLSFTVENAGRMTITHLSGLPVDSYGKLYRFDSSDPRVGLLVSENDDGQGLNLDIGSPLNFELNSVDVQPGDYCVDVSDFNGDTGDWTGTLRFDFTRTNLVNFASLVRYPIQVVLDEDELDPSISFTLLSALDVDVPITLRQTNLENQYVDEEGIEYERAIGGADFIGGEYITGVISAGLLEATLNLNIVDDEITEFVEVFQATVVFCPPDIACPDEHLGSPVLVFVNDDEWHEQQAANTAPIIQGTPTSEAVVGENYSFTPIASDEDGDYLVFDFINLPEWLGPNFSTGEIRGVPASYDVGFYSNIQITVNDVRGTNSRVYLPEFSITVTGLPDTGNTDTGNTDTGNTDTGNTDTGNTDTGNTDTRTGGQQTNSTPLLELGQMSSSSSGATSLHLLFVMLLVPLMRRLRWNAK